MTNELMTKPAKPDQLPFDYIDYQPTQLPNGSDINTKFLSPLAVEVLTQLNNTNLTLKVIEKASKFGQIT